MRDSSTQAPDGRSACRSPAGTGTSSSSRTRAAFDPANPTTIGQTTLTVLRYNILGLGDAVAKLGGQPVEALSSRWRSALMPPCLGHPPDPRSTEATASRRRSTVVVWLYYRFGVILRDVSELMLARGIAVSHEAIRLWTLRFGTEYARRLRRTRGTCSNVGHLDELYLMIDGERGWLWWAVDDAGEVLDILVQRCRSALAAKRFFPKLLKGFRMVPRAIVTDRL